MRSINHNLYNLFQDFIYIDLKDKQSFINTKVFLFEDSLMKLLLKKMDLVVTT